MLVDSNLVLKEGAVTATGAGDPVGLTSLRIPGKGEPVPFAFKVTESFAGGTSVAFKLQQSASRDGSYADVDGSEFTLATAALTVGARAPVKYLPRGVTKPWLKLAWTVTGSFTAGKIFAALAREDIEPYEAGQYIDGGRVEG
ncbi:MAG: hypothetical protein LUG19_07775 [Desulfovibrio sp.]|uniref:Bbp16 family capsid cement protein n=1 Tax=Desulfovibrio sp. TaxID=885 RepID=UPI0025871435|nr:hypothetical protein [Desulfovibrio sp.]MCD7984136.1 hypothetical protein [Desulfovibrio sp.]